MYKIHRDKCEEEMFKKESLWFLGNRKCLELNRQIGKIVFIINYKLY